MYTFSQPGRRAMTSRTGMAVAAAAAAAAFCVAAFDAGAQVEKVHRQVAAKLREALCGRDGACPRTSDLKGHNHISEIVHLDSEDLSLGPDLLEFVRGK
jgi:hypothetical protein